ncbi:hypothetical protein PHISP_00040 [Aspergillus sp. HF37]|nr:hypothetical protein PHISP_00040 [Aspergillus sp. HF37]
MSSIYRSNARLRTRAGCLECRKRRKKCDEKPPQCGGCYRNGLSCTWPTADSQPADGRRRPHRALRRDSQKAISALNLPSFRLDDHVDLYQHFAACIIPRLVRQNCLSEYVEQTHMLRLALGFPPLMAIMIAIAALDLGTPAHNQVAMEGYLYSLRSLQDRMNHDSNAGSEDGLLATTICLCVFEVRVHILYFHTDQALIIVIV